MNARLTLPLAFLALAPLAHAQPVFVTHHSLEARIAEADTVVRGRIIEIKRIEVVPPGGRNDKGILEPDGIHNHDIIMTVDEVLKGKAKQKLDNLFIIEAFHYRQDYDAWLKSGAALLVYLGPEPPAGQRRTWNAMRLDPRGHFERVYSADLTVLKDTKSVLDRAQTYASISTKKVPMHSFRLPPALDNGNRWSSLLVPVDAALEDRALKWIASPQDFAPVGAGFDDLAQKQLRYAGVTSLRYFKSDGNAEILRAVAKEPIQNFMFDFQGPYSVQKAAYETLARWDVKTPLVKEFAQKRKAGPLREARISDAGLRSLNEMDLLHTISQASTRGDKRPLIAGDVIAFDLDRAAISDQGLRELARLEYLESFSARETQINGSGFKDLHGLKSLAVVNLDRSQVTDGGLKEIARLPNLSRLTLAQTKITDDGLKELVGATQLKVLDLEGTAVTAAGVTHLAGLKNLVVLNLTGPQITDTTLRSLREMGMLRTLSPDTTLRQKHPASDKELTLFGFDGTLVTDDGLKELAGLAGLRTLSVGGTKITGAGFKHLAGLPRLTEIFAHHPQFTEEGLVEIASLKNLKTLHMHGKDVTDARLRALCKCGMVHVLYDASSRTEYPPATFPPRAKTDDAVRSLDLGGWRSTEGTVVTDAILKDLANLKNLEKLDLTHTYVSGSALKELAKLQHLTTLSLGGPQVRDVGLKDLPMLKKLTTLGLHDTNLTSAGMKQVAELKNLKSLKLTGKAVTDAWLAELHSLEKLTFLRLYWTSVTKEGIAAFQKARPECTIQK